jgi:hypothetical protein
MNTCLLALAVAVGSWLGLPGGAWIPSDRDIAQAKAQLWPYVEARVKSAHADLAPRGRYTFQYRGETLQGRRILMINAFCTPPGADAATRQVTVADGGACFFKAYWDPEGRVYAGLAFNGLG